ncbi:MAG: hypothetical protein LBJ89_04910 [Holosporales bacterium]|jgi:hypothetical protein|nr:hypothetical protein [Holosporales bacterium]
MNGKFCKGILIAKVITDSLGIACPCYATSSATNFKSVKLLCDDVQCLPLVLTDIALGHVELQTKCAELDTRGQFIEEGCCKLQHQFEELQRDYGNSTQQNKVLIQLANEIDDNFGGFDAIEEACNHLLHAINF